MKTHIANQSLTGAPRVDRKEGDLSSPKGVQIVAAGRRFDPRDLGIDDAALKRMIKRGSVRKVRGEDNESRAPTSAHVDTGSGSTETA